MAGKSPFFARIKVDVLNIVASIPSGKCSTYKSIGEHLDVVPRHVAYILAKLSDDEKARHPWHRVVGNDGVLGQPKVSESGVPQSVLLKGEGLLIADNRIDVNHHDWYLPAGELESGVPQQTRPNNAHGASPKRVGR